MLLTRLFAVALLYLSLRNALFGLIVVLRGESFLQDLVLGLVVPWDAWLIVRVVVYTFGLLELSALWRTHRLTHHYFVLALRDNRVGICNVCCQFLP